MRPALGLFTALPVEWDGEDVERAWTLAPLVGLLIGLVWFLFQQLVVPFGGPLVAGIVVVGINAAMTGGRGLRGLGALAGLTEAGPERPGAPPPMGAGVIAMVLVMLAEVALLQRVNLAPSMIVIVPVVARTGQVLALGPEDEGVALEAPSGAHKVAAVVLAAALMAASLPLAALSRPVRLGVLDGMEYVALGLAALAAGVVGMMVVKAWLRARFGSLDASGWHTCGLAAELVALTVVAARIA